MEFWIHLIKQLLTSEIGLPLDLAVGLGEYHIPWVDKSRGQPHQKSIIV
jgi:hypothetical protein